MDRVFLDANVLVSAARTPASRLRDLWSLSDVRLLGSPYVVEEARRNTPGACLQRLEELLSVMALLPVEPDCWGLPAGVQLPSKDLPILAAARASGASHLLTGDVRHFGPFMGTAVLGVQIMLPGEYLRQRGAAPCL